ncbi:Rhodopsin, GQ-coupled [Geodia barretti]|uniref:Rhodopsin, GQ-coupled n=1 Tax=Geodia barretti TaxID=519541 RepID=A0AA35U273_GEOBA|nr:Rhodopsin, GQ-coupled [Geodia barretti]
MANYTNMSDTFIFNDTENSTEFNCLADDISDSNVTNSTFWRIFLKKGAPAVSVVFGIYFLLAFIWNLFIIVTFLNKRKLLREPANILLLNLAIADLTVAMTQMFFSMVTAAYVEFVFGASDVVRCGMCDFTGVFFMLLYAVSVHTLAVLSFDRFLLLFRPFRYKKIMTPRNTVIIVVLVWVISAVISLPPLGGFGQIEFNRRFGSCVPRFGGTNLRSGLNNFYYIVYVTITSLFPIVTIAVCSFWTYRFINKFLRRNYRRRSFYSRRGRDSGVQQQQEDTRYHHQQQQLVKVFGALLVSNIVSWFPVILVVVVIAALGGRPEKVPDAVYVVGWVCFLTAPVFHPIIESFFVKDMRLVVCKGITRVNRAGSFIARSTTGMFANKDMEMANEKAEDTEYVSKRKIKFFRRGGSKRSRLTSQLSMTTEVTDIPLPSSRNNTPSPSVTQKLEQANRAATATVDAVQLRDKSSPNDDAECFSSKPARRITFSDESPPLLHRDEGSVSGETAESPVTRNGVRKSAMKLSSRDRPVVDPCRRNRS